MPTGAHHEPSHGAQHGVDPPGTTHRRPAGPGEHLPGADQLGVQTAHLGPGVAQPDHEQPEVLHSGVPVAPAVSAHHRKNNAMVPA